MSNKTYVCMYVIEDLKTKWQFIIYKYIYVEHLLTYL